MPITLVATGSYDLTDIQLISFYPAPNGWSVQIVVGYVEVDGQKSNKSIMVPLCKEGLDKLNEIFPLVSNIIKTYFSISQDTVPEIAAIKESLAIQDGIKTAAKPLKEKLPN